MAGSKAREDKAGHEPDKTHAALRAGEDNGRTSEEPGKVWTRHRLDNVEAIRGPDRTKAGQEPHKGRPRREVDNIMAGKRLWKTRDIDQARCAQRRSRRRAGQDKAQHQKGWTI
jgi:hypothetical protein